MAIKSSNRVNRERAKKKTKVEICSYLGIDGGLFFQLSKQNRKR